MKRAFTIGLVLVIWLAMAPLGVFAQGEAVPQTEAVAEVVAEPMTIEQLQEKYPHGSYWNHTKGGAEDYTWNPCTHHRGSCTYSGSCGCNTYRGKSIQCMGFAYQLAALAYGCEPSSEWAANYNKSALDTLKAGDIVRYSNNSHSIFVLAVEGDTVIYADCNSDNRCQIQWYRTTTKAQLKATFTYVKAAPYALFVPETAALSVSASAKTVTVGQEVTVSLTYRGGEQAIGALMGALQYDAALFSYVSYQGEDVEIHAEDGVIRYVYYATQVQAPTTLNIAFTFAATAAGGCDFAVTTEEFANDTDYASLGNPTGQVTVTATAPTLTITYHGGGGEIPRTATAYTYEVWSDNGINMRKDAGTSYGKLTALPYGTVFTVQVGDTKVADGYTWGKTTYKSYTGWVVISDFVDQVSVTYDGAWYLDNGIVTLTDGGALSHSAGYGTVLGEPLSVEEIGLVRDGYRFDGWWTTPEGEGIRRTADMRAEDLAPLLSEGDAAVVLYARWVLPQAGDVDGDGRVNNRDLGLLQRYLNGWDVAVCAEADVNGDGKINNKDMGLLQRIVNEEWSV